MGLFRRGAKLLKLGAGLRDCCCRPEKPEECWCPDWCRYYWEWGGNEFLPTGELLTNQCQFDGQDTVQAFSLPLPFGLAETSPFVFGGNPHYAGVFGLLGPQFTSSGFSGIEFTYDHSAVGILADGVAQETGFVDARYITRLRFLIYCVDVSTSLRNDAAFIFTSRLFQSVSITNAVQNVNYNAIELYRFVGVKNETIAPVSASCLVGSNYSCAGFLGGAPNTLHLLEDVEFSASADGVSVAGTEYSWDSTTLEEAGSDLPWQVEGHYPTPGILATVKGKASCLPGEPCDCTAPLTNRTVLFEGKEMTYGQQDNFFFPANPGDPYSGTWWEESPVGTFTRRDVENCDGTLNQRVKVVEVDCINEGGTDKWVAYLDHTCNERDDLTCPGPADAQRVKQWTGFFLCDENGSPTGSPTDLEVDSDTTSGTPAAECVDALQPPSFEFL